MAKTTKELAMKKQLKVLMEQYHAKDKAIFKAEKERGRLQKALDSLQRKSDSSLQKLYNDLWKLDDKICALHAKLNPPAEEGV